MVGRNAAIFEVGRRRRELHGVLAFGAWLGVHAWLLSGFRERATALWAWGWDYFPRTAPRRSSDPTRPASTGTTRPPTGREHGTDRNHQGHDQKWTLDDHVRGA